MQCSQVGREEVPPAGPPPVLHQVALGVEEVRPEPDYDVDDVHQVDRAWPIERPCQPKGTLPPFPSGSVETPLKVKVGVCV